MTVRSAQAIWKGTLKEGAGELSLESGAYTGPYDFRSRFETGPTTNPEELLGAAHASCYVMFLSALLSVEGLKPEHLHAISKVHLGDGPTLTKLELHLDAQLSGITEAKLRELAQNAKEQCPISKALGAVAEMTLEIQFTAL
jgi:lipoyl-dependent peroxiredoxin